MTKQGKGYKFRQVRGWEISDPKQGMDHKTRDGGTNTDLFRGLLAKTGGFTGEQGVHPHWGSLRSDRELTQPGPKW